MGIISFLLTALGLILVSFIVGFFLGKWVKEGEDKVEELSTKQIIGMDDIHGEPCKFKHHNKYVENFGWCTACGSSQKIDYCISCGEAPKSAGSDFCGECIDNSVH